MNASILRFHATSTSSTNEDGLQWIRGVEPGAVGFFSTDHQREGKGQRGRIWNSEPGDLTWSCAWSWPARSENADSSSLHSPSFFPHSAFSLNKSIALAVHQVLQHQLAPSCEFRIKWPNDLFALTPSGWKKCGGILIENNWRRSDWQGVVAGIGLNINSTHGNAVDRVSLRDLLGHSVAIDQARNLLEKAFEGLLTQWFKPVPEAEFDLYVQQLSLAYNERLLGLNHLHVYEYRGAKIQATLAGVDEQGRCLLLVDSNSDQRQLLTIDDHAQLKWPWTHEEPINP